MGFVCRSSSINFKTIKMRAKGLFFSVAFSCALFSCSDDEPVGQDASVSSDEHQEEQSVRMTQSNAMAIADLFSGHRSVMNDEGENKTLGVSPEVTSMSCYVEDGDTLLYAFNYGEDDGFIVLGSVVSSYPVFGYSDKGSVDFAADNGGLDFFCDEGGRTG